MRGIHEDMQGFLHLQILGSSVLVAFWVFLVSLSSQFLLTQNETRVFHALGGQEYSATPDVSVSAFL